MPMTSTSIWCDCRSRPSPGTAAAAFAEIGKPDKALPHLRVYVQNADAIMNEDEAEKVLGSRFVIAQMLVAADHADEALAELEAMRPLLTEAFGANSVHVRNLNRQIDRLGQLPNQLA
jgi:hypothetical protein